MSTQGDGDLPAIDEVRTRRFVVIDDRSNERAVIEIVQDHIELRLLSAEGSQRCEVLLFTGAEAPGTLAAGIELWVNGDSVAGCSAVATDSEIELHRFPYGRPECD